MLILPSWDPRKKVRGANCVRALHYAFFLQFWCAKTRGRRRRRGGAGATAIQSTFRWLFKFGCPWNSPWPAAVAWCCAHHAGAGGVGGRVHRRKERRCTALVAAPRHSSPTSLILSSTTALTIFLRTPLAPNTSCLPRRAALKPTQAIWTFGKLLGGPRFPLFHNTNGPSNRMP